MGEAIMGRTATSYNPTDYFAQGTYAQVLKSKFSFGRTTVPVCAWNVGLMPDAEKGCDGLKPIFIDNIYAKQGDAWALTAAISGAHTLGSAKLSASGYNGFWSNPNSGGVFDNDYYRSLAFKGWNPLLAVGGNLMKNQWQRSDKGREASAFTLATPEMMLNTDMCLLY